MNEHERVQGLKGSWDWLRFAAQLPAKPIPVKGQSANMLVASGRYILTGFSFLNTATGGTGMNLYDGMDTSGVAVVLSGAGANSSFSGILPGRGVLLEIGCYLQIQGGTLTGAVYLIPLWDYPWSAPGD